MSKVSKRLGRGLDSLVTDLRSGTLPDRLSTRKETARSPDKSEVASPADGSLEVPINGISANPFQPRGAITDESVASLASSLQKSGMIQPISVRRVGKKLQIIAGERRWRAAKVAGLKKVPVVVRTADDRQMLEMALVENIQREDLNAVDRAQAYHRYCEEFSVSAEELAGRLGEDRTTVTNYLRLLELPLGIKEMVIQGQLSMGHARCLVGLPDDAQRHRLAKAAVVNGLSVRALEEVIRREKRGAGQGTKEPRSEQISPHLRDLQERLAVATGTKVSIVEGRRSGHGRIVIEYYSLDDFDRITSGLGVESE